MSVRQLSLPLAAPGAEPVPTVDPAPPSDRPSSPPPPPAPAIRFVRRRGTKRYILRVLDDGSLQVTLPWWGTQREARAFVASQAAWIARQRARRAAAPDRRWRLGDAVLVDGVARPLTLDAGSQTLRCGAAVIGGLPAEEDLRPVVERWLRARAARELPTALAALADVHGIGVSRVVVRNQRSRWGSCSRRGAISLNWRLVQAPPFVREYVLVHELMHRRELNHSARFWRHVAAACPRFVEARRWLRREGQALF